MKLKERNDYRLLGKWYTGVDNRTVVTGAPLFGIDQTLPGMKIAVFERCPAVGGKVRSANLDEVKALPGVRDAFVIEGNGKTTEVMPGVAIVADTTWARLRRRASSCASNGTSRRLRRTAGARSSSAPRSSANYPRAKPRCRTSAPWTTR